MKKFVRTAWLFLFVSLLFFVGDGAQAEAQGSFDQELIRLTNNHRATIGRAPLVSSPTLSSGALDWSAVMRNTGNFKHASGLGSLGENIAFSHGPVGHEIGVNWSTTAGSLPSYCKSSMDYTSIEFVMCQWLSSPGHRRAIESADYRQVGSGTATGPGEFGRMTYSTMRFSASAPATATVPPANVVEPGHSVAANTGGDVVVIALKDDGALWIRRNLGASWSAWQSLGAGNWASTDVAIRPDGSAHVVAVKSTGRLYTVQWFSSGSFSSWTDHGAGWAIRTTPSISANSSRVVLGAIRADGELHTKTQEGGWSGATVHGATGWATVDVDVATDGDIWLAGVKSNGRLFVRKHLGQNWSGFASMGAPTWSTTTPPAIAARSDGVIFAAVKRDGRLYTREQNSGVWAGWGRQGVSSWSSVDIDMAENGHVWLAANKSWGRLYTRERTVSGAWHSWGKHGADTWSTNAAPSVSAPDGNSPVLLDVKANGILYQRYRSAGGWSSWIKLGRGSWAPGR